MADRLEPEEIEHHVECQAYLGDECRCRQLRKRDRLDAEDSRADYQWADR